MLCCWCGGGVNDSVSKDLFRKVLSHFIEDFLMLLKDKKKEKRTSNK